eukprot:scaffold3854_cov120-Skeletonema_marinoi.AAC.1
MSKSTPRNTRSLVELFRAFRIFNPSYAKTLSRKDAFALIEKLDHYPIFRQGGYVAKLKKGWNAYKQNASFVVADFGKTKDGEKDKSAILTWHYRMFLRIDEDEADDNHCRYCPKEARGSICYDDLKTWWDAVKLHPLYFHRQELLSVCFLLPRCCSVTAKTACFLMP